MLACVALAAGMTIPEEDLFEDEASQLAVIPNNDQEVAQLSGKDVIFGDFCIRARDHIIRDIKQTSNGIASDLFTLFFASAEKLVTDAVDVNRNAANRLGEQIRNPEAEFDYPEGEGPDSVIADGQRKIKEAQVQPRSFIQAFISAISATGAALRNGVLERLEYIKNQASQTQLVMGIQAACARAELYEKDIRAMFVDYVNELKASDPTMATTQIESVNCVTAKRIMRIEGFCRLAGVAQGPLMKILNLRGQN